MVDEDITSPLTNAIGGAGPHFEEMVRRDGPITLGDAKAYMGSLSTDQKKHPCCGCYTVRCPASSSCCPGSCVGVTCNSSCGDYLWYCCFFGACYNNDTGMYSCTDLKGNDYVMVKVDKENEKWAWFSENTLVNRKGDEREVSCFCVKTC